MYSKNRWTVLTLMLAMALLFSACAAPAAAPAASDGDAPAAEEAAPADTGSIQIPEVVDGKFNVAFVYVGPIGDGGWTYAHNQGREYIEANMGDTISTAYLESVP